MSQNKTTNKKYLVDTMNNNSNLSTSCNIGKHYLFWGLITLTKLATHLVVLVPHEPAQGLPVGDQQQPEHHADREKDDERPPPTQRGLAPGHV